MRLRLDLAYDGTGFRGWARQPGLRTVQGELEDALDTVLRTSGSRLTVAGRTDSGVHARGQVAHLDVDEDVLDAVRSRHEGPAVEALLRRLNGVVGGDVRLHRVTVAPAGFDARFSATWRRYAYRIADEVTAVDPLHRGHVVVWPRTLDVEAMNEAAVGLMGLNDFAAFCRKRAGATTVRALLDLSWTRIDGVVEATVRADAFCHSMVRALVGCLTAVGEGRREPGWAAEVMKARVRDSGVVVAPAHGLTLEEVAFPADADLGEQATQTRARRGPVED